MRISQLERRRLWVALLEHVSAARTARRRRLLRHLQARAAWVEQARLAPSMATLTELTARPGSTPLDEWPVPRRKRGPGPRRGFWDSGCRGADREGGLTLVERNGGGVSALERTRPEAASRAHER
jgi:hypothetical protein